MAVQNSTQAALVPTAVSAPARSLRPTEKHGRQRILYANFAASAYVWAQNDFGVVGTLPKGARITLVQIVAGAFGAGVTLDVGLFTRLDNVAQTGTENAIVAAQAVASAVTLVLNPLNLDTELATDSIVGIKFEGGNPADNIALTIAITYVID